VKEGNYFMMILKYLDIFMNKKHYFILNLPQF
jgi:hypothetical protein